MRETIITLLKQEEYTINELQQIILSLKNRFYFINERQTTIDNFIQLLDCCHKTSNNILVKFSKFNTAFLHDWWIIATSGPINIITHNVNDFLRLIPKGLTIYSPVNIVTLENRQ